MAASDLNGVAVGDDAIFAGGNPASTTVQIYNAATGQWSTSIMPLAETGLQAVGAADGKAVFYSPSDGKVFTFDPQSGQWTTGSLSSVRSNVATAIVGNYALFAGGAMSSTPSNAVDVYNIATGQWSTTTLPYAASLVCAVADGGLAYFAGGTSSQGDVDDFCSFDPSTGTWSDVQHLSYPRSGVQGTVLGNDVLIGGDNWVDIYDTTDGGWSVMTAKSVCSVALSVGDTAIFDSSVGDIGTYADVYTQRGGPLTATLLPTPVLRQDKTNYQFSVAYHDPDSIDRSSIAAGDINVTDSTDLNSLITSADLNSYLISLDSVAVGKHPSTVIATYSFAAPARRFRFADNGTFNIKLVSGAVSDKNDQTAPGDLLGTFQVAIPAVQPAQKPVRRGDTMSTMHDSGAATTVDGQAIFAGGSSFAPDGPSNVADIYNSVTGKWTVAALSRYSAVSAAVTIGDEALFVEADQYNSSDSVKVIDIYNAKTGAWSYTLMPEGHDDPGVAVVGNDLIIAGGGLHTNEADIYDVPRPGRGASQPCRQSALSRVLACPSTTKPISSLITAARLRFTMAAVALGRRSRLRCKARRIALPPPPVKIFCSVTQTDFGSTTPRRGSGKASIRSPRIAI